MTLKYFRSHVVDCSSDHGCCNLSDCNCSECSVLAHIKVSYLWLFIFGHEDVLRFDVTVNHTTRVNVFQSSQDLSEDGLQLNYGRFSLLCPTEQVSILI